MARGKRTCRILKEIRRQIAEANDIEYVVEECQYKGDCKGTCPKCEAEVHYLEEQLHQRQILGKAVMVAGLSLGVVSNAMAQDVSIVETPSDSIVSVTTKEVTGKYIIRGKVIEKTSNDVVIAAAVILNHLPSKNHCITDRKGEFAIGVDSLPVDITVKYVGLKDLTFHVTEENYNQYFLATLVESESTLGMIEVNSDDEKVIKKTIKAMEKEHRKRMKKVRKEKSYVTILPSTE